MDEAYAGDVVGIVGNYDFQIGDTLAEDAGVAFDEMPRFAPETFAFLHNGSASNFKRFREGLSQLLKEGVAQSYELADSPVRVPLLGAVGTLQFDVLQYRLETEYGAPTRLESASWNLARWVIDKSAAGKRRARGEATAPEASAADGIRARARQPRRVGRAVPERVDGALFRREEPDVQVSRCPSDASS